jgi:hypothetical protein
LKRACDFALESIEFIEVVGAAAGDFEFAIILSAFLYKIIIKILIIFFLKKSLILK